MKFRDNRSTYSIKFIQEVLFIGFGMMHVYTPELKIYGLWYIKDFEDFVKSGEITTFD